MSDPSPDESFAAQCPGAFFLDAANLDSLAAYLISRGFLQPEEIISRLGPAGEGNMNLTLRVETGFRSFIIKQSRPWVEKYPQLAAPWDRVLREAKFYEITRDVPAIAGKMPEVLLVDARSRILVLEDLGKGPDYLTLYAGERLLTEAELSSLADYLTSLHSLTADPATREMLTNRELRQLNHDHIFTIPLTSGNGLDLDQITPGLAEVAARLQENESYVRRAAELGKIYLADGATLLHGDFYPGSWLHSADGLRVIDPEFAHFGLAEFELGVLWAHLILTNHPEESWEAFLSVYHSSDGFDTALMNQFAGVEIMRRLIGYAQLPLPVDLATKRRWLARSEQLVLGGAFASSGRLA